MSILIYKIDSSKLVPIGKPGYQKGQEQAKVYFDEVPKDDFTVAITDVALIQKIGYLANVDLSGNYRILIGVDNRDPERVGLDITYIDRHCDAAKSCVISYTNCPQESDYGLANKLLGFIEEAFYAQKEQSAGKQQKGVDGLIADASKRSGAAQELGTRKEELGKE